MYRTPAGGRPSDALVICRACGAAKPVAIDDVRSDMIECPACHVEQAALRGREDMEVITMTLQPKMETSSYENLCPFLSELGDTTSKASQISVDCDGISVLVSISTNSGSVVGVELVAMTNGLPEMRLVQETDAHRQAATKGVVRELQTGDAEFDDDVYIETTAADRDVSVMLSSAAVRSAAMGLVAVGDDLWVTPTYVKVVIGNKNDPFVPQHLRERLAWLRVVAGAPRVTAATPTDVPLLVTLLNLAPMAISPMGIALIVLGLTQYSPYSANFLWGAPIGLAVALALFPVYSHVLRGRSSALREIRRARLILVSAVPVFGIGLAIVLNGGLDRSAGETVEMKVIAASVDSDDSSKIDVTAQGPDGKSHAFSYHAAVPKGPARVRAHLHPGFFGWQWQQGESQLLLGEELPKPAPAP